MKTENTLPDTTILIIDDNKELLWMLKDILSDEYAILTAENGEEGLEVLKQETPDLINHRYYDAQKPMESLLTKH